MHRVVIGSAAVEHPEVVDELATLHPGQVAVGLDARARDVAIHGWTDETGLDLVDLARRFGAIPGVGALVVTGIDRDGTLEGPDVDQLARCSPRSTTPLIASGGVGTLDDLRALAAVDARRPRLRGRDRRPRHLRAAVHRRGGDRRVLAVRVIPCLDVDAGRVVKGVRFVEIRDAGDPVELAARYDAEGADELVFLDITASSDDRDTMVHVVERVADQVFIVRGHRGSGS